MSTTSFIGGVIIEDLDPERRIINDRTENKRDKNCYFTKRGAKLKIKGREFGMHVTEEIASIKKNICQENVVDDGWMNDKYLQC